jgi:DNA repair protein RecO (recombination protein O)
MYKKFTGIVLKRTRFSESSAYITVLTDAGIEKFSAKGVFSKRNKNSHASSLYALSEFVVSCKGESATMSSATLMKSLIQQGVDFEALSVANYISNLSLEVSFTEEDSKKVYALLGTALSIINQKTVEPKIVKAVFELRLMSHLGFEPELDECAECGCEFHGGSFMTSEGYVLCDKCEAFSTLSKVAMSTSLKNAIKTLLSLSDAQSFGIRFANDTQKEEFTRLSEEFSLNHLDSARASLEYYKTNIQNLTGLI